MDKLIHDVIRYDKETRKKVEEAKAEREKILQEIEDEKSRIKKEKWQEAKKQIKDRKQEIQDSLEAKKTEAYNEFKDGLKHLDTIYKEHKDTWVQTLYEACIDDEK